MSGKAPGHRFQDALASIVANDEAGAAFPDFAGAGVGLLLAPRLHRSANLINGRFVGDEVAHRGLRVRSERKPLLNGRAYHAETDRKSVVEGKSVSGRVDLGGRRIIKKKKRKKKQ